MYALNHIASEEEVTLPFDFRYDKWWVDIVFVTDLMVHVTVCVTDLVSGVAFCFTLAHVVTMLWSVGVVRAEQSVWWLPTSILLLGEGVWS